MATDGQFYWPSVGNYVAAYGQFFMAANTPEAWRRSKRDGMQFEPPHVVSAGTPQPDVRVALKPRQVRVKIMFFALF